MKLVEWRADIGDNHRSFRFMVDSDASYSEVVEAAITRAENRINWAASKDIRAIYQAGKDFSLIPPGLAKTFKRGDKPEVWQPF